MNHNFKKLKVWWSAGAFEALDVPEKSYLQKEWRLVNDIVSQERQGVMLTKSKSYVGLLVPPELIHAMYLHNYDIVKNQEDSSLPAVEYIDISDFKSNFARYASGVEQQNNYVILKNRKPYISFVGSLFGRQLLSENHLEVRFDDYFDCNIYGKDIGVYDDSILLPDVPEYGDDIPPLPETEGQHLKIMEDVIEKLRLEKCVTEEDHRRVLPTIEIYLK